VRFLLLCLLALLLLSVLVPAGLTVAALQDRPAVAQSHVPGPDDAARAKATAKRLLDGLLAPAGEVSFSAVRADLAAALAFVDRGLPRASSEVRMEPGRLDAAVAIRVPANPFGRYLNLRLGLVSSTDGLRLAGAAVGPFEFPGALALAVARLALDTALGSDSGTLMLQQVRAVEVTANRLTVRFAPVAGLKADLKQVVERLRALRDRVAPLGDPATVRVYYARLVGLDAAMAGGRARSLADYLGPLAALARERSAAAPAHAENRAMVLALAMYFGDARFFERLIGRVRTGELEGRQAGPRGAVLAGRRDLLLHFVISAGLEVAGQSAVASAIGEFKELLDSNEGGSGFSFVDLAADRAGVRFAEAATDPAQAARLQAALAGRPAEAVFFPEVAGLVEGLPAAAFEAAFGGVEDARYKAMVREIDARIARAPAYR